MGHTEMVDDATIGPEPIETRPGDLETSGHGDVVGDRQQQGSAVGIAIAQQGLDLERGPLGIGGIDHPGVVHDMLEHRQGTDAHQRGRGRGRVVGSMSE